MAHPKAKNIAVKRGTVVMLRDGQGRLTGKRGIVMANQKPSAFSRAYGRQVFVCVVSKARRSSDIYERGARDLYPVGKVKKIPKTCREALAAEKAAYPSLSGARRRRKKR